MGRRCYLCGKALPGSGHKGWNWHHRYPRNPPRGWPHLPDRHHEENLVRVHKTCNTREGNRITDAALVAYHELTDAWPHSRWPRQEEEMP